MPTIRTERLDVDLRDDGPRGGRPLLLVHGWPDDASTWDAVLPALHAAGHRTIVPSLRGFGATRFRSADVPRTGNTGIHALDVIDTMDALGIGRFAVAGHDWGSNIAEALACGWPDRVEKIAMLSTPSRLGGMKTSPFWHARLQWYHWLQATERGAAAVRADPIGFCRIMWDTWSPKGWYDEATFERVSASWRDNPDFVDVTLHSYRARWDVAEPDPASVWLEQKVKATPRLSVPNLFVTGEVDGVNPPPVSEKLHEKFSGLFERVVLPGVGHFPQREAPGEVARRLVAHFAS